MRPLFPWALLVGVLVSLMARTAEADCGTVTVGIAASGDDAAAQGLNSASYPPGFTSCNTTATTVTLTKTNAGGGTPYSVRNLLLQWDTAAVIPGGATIAGATLRLRVSTGGSSADSRNFTAEWFDWGATCTTADYNAATGNNAHSGTALTSITASSSDADPRDFALSNVSNISQTGGVRTYMKIGIDGGQPTGTNTLVVVSQDNTTLTEPQLLIDYCTGDTPTPTSANTSTPTRTITPVASASAVAEHTRTITPAPPATGLAEFTLTPTITRTPTDTPIETSTPAPTVTPAPPASAVAIFTPTATQTPTTTPTISPAPPASAIAVFTPTRTVTPTATNTGLPTPTNTPWCESCTLWIGFSQAGNPQDVGTGTSGWFKSGTPDCFVDSSKAHWLPDDRTELRWCGGCGVERWSVSEGNTFNGAASAWDSSCSGAGETDCYYSECSSGSSSPDRIVFVVTDALVAPDLVDADDYQPYITDAIAQIRSHYPSAHQIILQSVAGGPGGGLCYCNTSGSADCSDTGGAGRDVVRASENYPIIVEAIGDWIAAHPSDTDVVGGAMPTVASCADFSDLTGHLLTAGACTLATSIAAFYEPTAAAPCAPTPTATPTPANTATTTRTITPAAPDTAVAEFTRTATATPTPQPTDTPTSTETATPVPTDTRTPTSTITRTITPAAPATAVAEFTRTATPTNTETPEPTDTPTETPTPVSTATVTRTVTPAAPASAVAEHTRTVTATLTATLTATRTETPTITRAPTVTPTLPPVQLGVGRVIRVFPRPALNAPPPRRFGVRPPPVFLVPFGE